MSSSTVSRYRESSAVTSPIKIYDQNNISFAEEYALDAIAKEVCIYLIFLSLQSIHSQRLNFVFNINVNKIMKHVKFDIKN